MLSIQSGPAGASPTRFWPADRIARLTPEASYARLHREADLDKIGATIGNRGTPPDWRSAAGPQKQVRSAPPKRPIRAARPSGEASRFRVSLSIRPIRSPTKKTAAEIAVTATRLLGVSAATKVNTARR